MFYILLPLDSDHILFLHLFSSSLTFYLADSECWVGWTNLLDISMGTSPTLTVSFLLMCLTCSFRVISKELWKVTMVHFVSVFILQFCSIIHHGPSLGFYRLLWNNWRNDVFWLILCNIRIQKQNQHFKLKNKLLLFKLFKNESDQYVWVNDHPVIGSRWEEAKC